MRGLHYQNEPHSETKLVTCLQGIIWDVLVDLRPESPTYRHWTGLELSAGNGVELYIPEGCAHGFQTLTDDVLLRYMISRPYAPDFATGIRYDDPALGIPAGQAEHHVREGQELAASLSQAGSRRPTAQSLCAA